MEFSEYMEKGLLSSVKELIKAYPGVPGVKSLSAMEGAVQAVTMAVGQAILGEWLTSQDEKYPSEKVGCECGGQAHYERRREAMTITTQGRVSYRRAYYRCSCGQGRCPLDEALGIHPGQMSDQLMKVAARFGITEGYERSAEALAVTTGVALSPNSVRHACQTRGEQVVDQEAALIARSHDLTEQRPHNVPPVECLYASLDGFYAPFEDGYHEVKMGAFWQVNRQDHATDIHYYLETDGLAAFSELVWARAFALGAQTAKQLVFVADGAVWIWHIVAQHFPHAIQIVDWYHASTYLVKVAHAAFGQGTSQAEHWLEYTKSALYNGDLATVVRACRQLTDRAPKTVSDARHYFAVNRTRLRYAKFRAMGLQIGSGTMESGCKQLGLARLTIAGARWSTPGARLLAKTRAAFLSHEITLPTFPALQVA